jgi:hypothetical protein
LGPVQLHGSAGETPLRRHLQENAQFGQFHVVGPTPKSVTPFKACFCQLPVPTRGTGSHLSDKHR